MVFRRIHLTIVLLLRAERRQDLILIIDYRCTSYHPLPPLRTPTLARHLTWQEMRKPNKYAGPIQDCRIKLSAIRKVKDGNKGVNHIVAAAFGLSSVNERVAQDVGHC